MNEPSEVDLIINMMRQSSLADVREYLEDLVRDIHDERVSKQDRVAASLCLVSIRELFRETSNNAPMP